MTGLPSWLSGKESACQCRRHGFHPWVRKTPGKGNGNPNKAFIPGEKKYPCKITNISGGGCCLSTKFPIKEGQYLFLTMPFINDKNTVLGKIVKTRNSMQQGLFNLHIHFEKIPLEIINKIQAEAHNFENSFQK